MQEESPAPDALPARVCPTCGEPNHGHAAYCMGCGASLDSAPAPSRGRAQSVGNLEPTRLESKLEIQDLTPWQPPRSAGFTPLKYLLRCAGILAVFSLTGGSLQSGQWPWSVLGSAFLIAYLGLAMAALTRRRRATSARGLGREPDGLAQVVICLDIVVRGVGCIAIGLVSVVAALLLICLASMR